jgi:hypothetical protein
MRAVDRAFDALAAFWHAPAPPARLAALRIIAGLFAWGYLCARWGYFSDYGRFTPADFRPIGVVALVTTAPLPVAAAHVLLGLAAVSGAAFVAGWRYRVTAPLFAALALWITTYRNSWGMIFHTENLFVMHVIALALAPAAADAWSLDARRRAATSPEALEPAGRHGWPIRLLSAITVAAYLIAGVTKLRNTGLDWVTTDFLRDYIAYDAIRKIELGSAHSPLGGWLAENYPRAFRPAAAFSLVAELAAPLALFSRKFATAWVAAIVLFHAGVLALMAILFPYPLFLFAFASFFDVERPIARAAGWLRDRQRRLRSR